MNFSSPLQPASLGGVRFAVLTSGGKFGRRQAIHEYPFRETGWIEDIGKSLRRLEITGFLLEDDLLTGGGSVVEQRNALIAMAESPRPVTLTHPTYGVWDVNVLQVEITERWDQGRYYEVFFRLIEAGHRVFPTVQLDYAKATEESALGAAVAAMADYATRAIQLVHRAAWIVRTAKSTVLTWMNIGYAVVNDATNLFSLVKSLAGPYGRFYGGNGFESVSRTNPANTGATARTAAESGATSRAAVMVAAGSLEAAAGTMEVRAIGTFIQATTEAIATATPDPAERIRLMAVLADTSATIVQLTEQVRLLTDLMRRSALIAMARACAEVQPQSADEAMAMRDVVVAHLDAEMAIAGDSGEDATFAAMLELRRAVIVTMNAKGAALPSTRRFTFAGSLPAEVIALLVYRDPGRGDEVAMESGAPHPAFQPVTMRLLST